MGKQLFKSLIMLGIFLAFGYTQAQKTVTGTVSDADGPLPGAAVVVSGTDNGVTTDFDGNYTIEANEGDVLEFTFIGMTTATATVGSDSVLNMTLASSENRLEEVVVVGYSSQTRGDITGSVASVDLDEALKVPVANAAEALQGRVTGVTVVSNGAPGAAPQWKEAGALPWTKQQPFPTRPHLLQPSGADAPGITWHQYFAESRPNQTVQEHAP